MTNTVCFWSLGFWVWGQVLRVLGFNYDEQRKTRSSVFLGLFVLRDVNICVLGSFSGRQEVLESVDALNP